MKECLVLGSPSASARHTKEPRTGGPPATGGAGGGGSESADPIFFLRKSLRTYLRALKPDCRPPGPIGTILATHSRQQGSAERRGRGWQRPEARGSCCNLQLQLKLRNWLLLVVLIPLVVGSKGPAVFHPPSGGGGRAPRCYPAPLPASRLPPPASFIALPPPSVLIYVLGSSLSR
jgi:hypothetical protein